MDLGLVRQALANPAPFESQAEGRRAAVAAVLKETSNGVGLLLIQRSERIGDPWSGHMALPGGHVDPQDRDLRETALRETQEELGVDLTTLASPLGQLDDLAPVRGMDLIVRPFVFLLHTEPGFAPSREVKDWVWAPLLEVAAGHLDTQHRVVIGSNQLTFPAFQVEGRVVWGLTYRIIQTLLSRVSETHAPLKPLARPPR